MLIDRLIADNDAFKFLDQHQALTAFRQKAQIAHARRPPVRRRFSTASPRDAATRGSTNASPANGNCSACAILLNRAMSHS